MYNCKSVYESTITKSDIYNEILHIMRNGDSAQSMEIVDGETGEVLFTYEHGNVTYISNEVASRLVVIASSGLYN